MFRYTLQKVEPGFINGSTKTESKLKAENTSKLHNQTSTIEKTNPKPLAQVKKLISW